MLDESLKFSIATLGRRMPLSRCYRSRFLWLTYSSTAVAIILPYFIIISIKITRNLRIFVGEGFFGYYYNTGMDHSGAFGRGFKINIHLSQGFGWLPRREGVYNSSLIYADILLLPIWFLLPFIAMIWVWAWLRHRLARKPICRQCGYCLVGQLQCPECGRKRHVQ